MKSLLLLLLAFFATHFCYAQWQYGTNYSPAYLLTGNVGIGTSTPQATLEISNSNIPAAFFTKSGGGWTGTGQIYNDGSFHIAADNVGNGHLIFSASTGVSFRASVDGNDNVYIDRNGNTGIGTNNPEAKLHVFAPLDGSISPITIGNGNDAGNTNVPFGSPTGGYNIDFKSWRDVAPDQVCARIRAERINNFQPNNALVQAMDLAFFTSYGVDQSQLTEKMRIKYNGNIGIGTTNPDQKLTVNGTIHSSSVVVDNAIPVPDYVFQKSYKLIDLPTLGEYLRKYHHLPEIPSATQIQKEGLNLGEMNTLLLKKVEELTLYVIEKDKEIKAQNDTNLQLINKVETLEKQVNLLLATYKKNN